MDNDNNIEFDCAQIIKHLPNATFAIDLDGKVIAWNNAIAEMTVIETEDMLGKGNYEYAIPFYGIKKPMLINLVLEQNVELESTYLSFSRSQHTIVGENETLVNNKKVYLWGTARLIYNPNREVIGAIETIRDISAIKKNEIALRESEIKFKMLAERSLIGVYLFQPKDNKHIYVNPAYSHIFEYEPDDMINNIGLMDLICPEDLPIIEDYISKKMDGELSSAQYEIRGVTKSEKIKHLEINGSIVDYHEEKAIVGMIQDITERKQTEKELEAYRNNLEDLVNKRTKEIQVLENQKHGVEKLAYAGQVAARVAHEINNPLGGIKNSFLLIKDAFPPDHEYYHYIELINKEINRMASIVKQMFGLYRPDVTSQDEFMIDDVIFDIVSLIESTRRERDVRIIINAPSFRINYIPESLLRQILYNLLINAIEASYSNTEVSILVKDEGANIVLTITDHGHGIPDEIRDHIFEPFTTSKKGGQKGLGLGLPITQKIINELGGSISFESTTGQGTVFTVTLPTIQKTGG